VPLAEHATSGLGPLQNAPVPVYCECSVRSLESTYLEAATLIGVHLHNFNKDFSAFEGITAANLQGIGKPAEEPWRTKRSELPVPKRAWALR